MLLGADEGEWAAVERRGPHLWASGRPFFVHDSFRGGRRPRGPQCVLHWAFNDGGYRALQLKPFSYDEKVFYVRARRDSVASAALVW
jgi:mannan endo-1,4-beta-mannosidase